MRAWPLALLATLIMASPARSQLVQINSNVSTSQSWGPTGSVVGTTFWIRNSIAVNAGVTLTIQPGVVIKFDPGLSLTVNGRLRAIGTAADTIVVTSIKDDNNDAGDTNGDGNTTVPGAGDWRYVIFPDAAPDSSRLQYCDIRFAGSGSTGALTFVSASDSVVNCVIRRSYYGVDCQGSAAPTLINTSIEASTQTPVVLDFTASPVLSSLVFSSSNNGYDAFGLRGGTLTSATTLPKRGATVGASPVSNVAYVLFGSLTINSPGSLTVSPGVVIKPVGGQIFQVNSGANLTMNGSAAPGDTITITSISDDNYGLPSDTNNNGSITAPQRGDWGRIVFAQGATGSISRCRFKFGSNSASQGVVEMTNNAIPVSNVLLSDAAHGLAIFGVSTPAVSNVEINNCSSTPILMSVSSNPTFTGISFLANAVTALGLEGENIAVDSRIALRTVAGYTNITYYLMNGALAMLSPAVLRIDPGIVIKGQLGGGGFVIDGALVADGKVDSLIVFTSERDDLYGNPADTNGDGAITAPARGDWGNIVFTGTSNDAQCLLDYCRLTYGSAWPYDGWPCTVNITNASPTITRCFFSRGYYGIRINGNSSPAIATCDFNNLAAAPVVMSVQSDPSIATDNTYSTNGYNAIALLSETIAQNSTIKYRPGVGSPTFAYLPTGTITVPAGVTLTVAPQVVLKPTSSFSMFIVSGALNMVGANNTTGRIIVTSQYDDNPLYGGDTTPQSSATPQAGNWGNIVFTDTAVDAQCVMRNILFQFGGALGNDNGAIYTASASPRLANAEFFQNVTAITCAGNSAPAVDSVSILNCTQLPIVSSLISNPTFANITLANNQYLAFGILGETIAQNVRTRVRSIAGYSNINYALSSTVNIAFGAKWTIDPGVVIKLGRISTDPIGTMIDVDGALVADGKPDSLIVFTSSADDEWGQDVRGDGALTQPAPGQWQYITFSAVSNDTATVIDNCVFRYGSYSGYGALYMTSAGPTITNTRFVRNNWLSVTIAGASTPTFTDCFMDSTQGGPPLNMSLVSEPVFNNTQFLGNTYTALGVIPEAIAQDVLWKIRAVSGRNNMPYLLQGQITTGLGATVRMQPGVVVKMTGGGAILVQRAFQAEATAPQPESLIVFTSYRDDAYGGDTNNDGSASAPGPSDWGSVTIDGTAIDPQCRFKNAMFRYGGSALRCVNSSPSVDSCLFAYNTVGISVEGASNPVVRGCSLFGNTQYAINNTGNSFCVSAEGNWWGAASGPNDNTATADLCGLGLNAGSGDRVSNNVDYLPFATSGILNPLLGDVSLNGQVLAYDASLVFQYNVALITLNELQQLVADVSGNNTVEGYDGSLILQFVAGIIKAFPAQANKAGRGRDGVASAPATFDLRLGDAVRAGDRWRVPLIVSGDAPLMSVDLRLRGATAASLVDVIPTDGGRVLYANNVVDGDGLVSMGAALALTPGTVAMLEFADDGDVFEAPEWAMARVNDRALDGPSPPPTPAVPAAAYFALPAPNPALQNATVRFGISSREAGANVVVDVLDVQGRTVRVLHRGPLAAGDHQLTWGLNTDDGGPVNAGLYFVRVRAARFVTTHRLTVVR